MRRNLNLNSTQSIFSKKQNNLKDKTSSFPLIVTQNKKK